MHLRKAITLQVDSFHIGPPSNDLHKTLDTQSILTYQPSEKVFKNCGAEFFKV